MLILGLLAARDERARLATARVEPREPVAGPTILLFSFW